MKLHFNKVENTKESLSNLQNFIDKLNSKYKGQVIFKWGLSEKKDGNMCDFWVASTSAEDSELNCGSATQFGSYVYLDIPDEHYFDSMIQVDICNEEYYLEHKKLTEL